MTVSDPAHEEFRRLQVEMRDRFDREKYDRAEILLREHGKRWAQDRLGSIADRVGVGWRDGEIQRISLSGVDFAVYGARLLERNPIRCVEITTLGTVHLGDIVWHPGMRSIRALSLQGLQLMDGSATFLAGAWELSNLRWLDLSRNRIGDLGFRALVGSAPFKNLVYLDMRQNPADVPHPVEDQGHVVYTHWPDTIPEEGAPGWVTAMAAGTRVAWTDV